MSFFASFLFFMFVFLVNQIIVLLTYDSSRGLSALSIIRLVILSTPQFIIFTFPFSSLMASSITIGELSSKNEILALRSSGISVKNMFSPLVIVSIFIAIVAYWTSDRLNPWAASQYKTIYSKIIKDMPAMTLKPNSSTQFGRITATVQDVKDQKLEGITILNIKNKNSSQMISAKSGSINQSKNGLFLYEIDLQKPQLYLTDASDENSFSRSSADRMVYSIDFSSMLPTFAEPSPSQVPTFRLLKEIQDYHEEMSEYNNGLKDTMTENINKELKEELNLKFASSLSEQNTILENITSLVKNYNYAKKDRFSSIMLSYIDSELQKRFALSFACVLLVFIALPLVYTKTKYGKLLGFAISAIISVIYWGMLFFAQYWSMQKQVNSTFWLVWAPNIMTAIFSVAVFLRSRRV